MLGIPTQAAVVDALNAQFVLRDVVLSEPRPDEIIVELEASGMCHADLSARTGTIPFPLPGVLGHEGVGRVVQIGARVADIAAGDRVVVSFSSCGHCAACLRTATPYCRDWVPLNLVGGSRADGSATLSGGDAPIHGHFFGQSSFSRLMVTSARAAVKVDDDLPASVLAPLGCGVQTGVGAALNVLRPATGARIAVFGTGAVGMSAIMGLVLTGVAQIIAIDIHSSRLELARELGATDTLDASSGDIAARLVELTSGLGLDGAIETSGHPDALRTAIGGLAAGGTCVIVGVPHKGEPLIVDVINTVSRGIRIRGTNQGDADPRAFIPRLVDLYRRGRLPIDKLVTDFRFADINQAANASLNGSVIKPVLHMT